LLDSLYNPLSAILKAAVVAAPFILTSPLQAGDAVPLCGPPCIHSSNSSPVEVTMIHELQRDRQARFDIPESALIYVPNLRRSTREALPDRIETDGEWIKFAIVAPDGRPFGKAVEDFARQKSVSLDAAATELRSSYAVVEISLIGRDVPDERLYSAHLLGGMKWSDLEPAEPFDGLPAKMLSFKTKNPDGTMEPAIGHRTSYFPANADDPFLMIQCENEPNPVYWCDYFVRPNDIVKLTIHMSDFRVYGGRKFVQDRLKMILRAYCDYDVACDP
jgi:hypothetical protein